MVKRSRFPSVVCQIWVIFVLACSVVLAFPTSKYGDDVLLSRSVGAQVGQASYYLGLWKRDDDANFEGPGSYDPSLPEEERITELRRIQKEQMAAKGYDRQVAWSKLFDHSGSGKEGEDVAAETAREHLPDDNAAPLEHTIGHHGDPSHPESMIHDKDPPTVYQFWKDQSRALAENMVEDSQQNDRPAAVVYPSGPPDQDKVRGHYHRWEEPIIKGDEPGITVSGSATGVEGMTPGRRRSWTQWDATDPDKAARDQADWIATDGGTKPVSGSDPGLPTPPSSPTGGPAPNLPATNPGAVPPTPPASRPGTRSVPSRGRPREQKGHPPTPPSSRESSPAPIDRSSKSRAPDAENGDSNTQEDPKGDHSAKHGENPQQGTKRQRENVDQEGPPRKKNKGSVGDGDGCIEKRDLVHGCGRRDLAADSSAERHVKTFGDRESEPRKTAVARTAETEQSRKQSSYTFEKPTASRKTRGFSPDVHAGNREDLAQGHSGTTTKSTSHTGSRRMSAASESAEVPFNHSSTNSPSMERANIRKPPTEPPRATSATRNQGPKKPIQPSRIPRPTKPTSSTVSPSQQQRDFHTRISTTTSKSNGSSIRSSRNSPSSPTESYRPSQRPIESGKPSMPAHRELSTSSRLSRSASSISTEQVAHPSKIPVRKIVTSSPLAAEKSLPSTLISHRKPHIPMASVEKSLLTHSPISTKKEGSLLAKVGKGLWDVGKAVVKSRISKG